MTQRQRVMIERIIQCSLVERKERILNIIFEARERLLEQSR
jgi:hypothetical protein